MSKKVYLDVKIRLILNVDENQNIGDVVDEMDYAFTTKQEGVDILDTEMTDFEIVDSK